jgi:hypothetical protein
MNVRSFHQQSCNQVELLESLLVPAESDRCEALGAEFIKQRIFHEPDCSDAPSGLAPLDLLRSLKSSLIERGATLSKLPRDRFASRQLGLDLRTLQAFQEKPVKNPELLRLVLHRFQARAYYWSEVEQLLLQRVGKQPTAG